MPRAWLASGTTVSTAGFVSDLVLQAATGCVLGFITSVLLSVVSAAGSLTDVTSGLAAATIFDPISGPTTR